MLEGRIGLTSPIWAVIRAAERFMDMRCQRLSGEAFEKAINTADDAESNLYAAVAALRAGTNE